MAVTGATTIGSVRDMSVRSAESIMLGVRRLQTSRSSKSCCDALSDRELQKHLSRSQAALHVLRSRVKCCWLILALLLGPTIEVYRYLHPGSRFHELSHLVQWLLCSVFILRMMMLSLAPAVNDIGFIRAIVIIDMMVIFSERVIGVQEGFILQTDSSILENLPAAFFYGRGVIFGIFGLWASCSATVDNAQRWMWCGFGVFAALQIIQKSAELVHFGLRQHRIGWWCVCDILSTGMLLLVASRPSLRKRLQGQVLQWMEGEAATRGAASLACIIGSVPPGEALAFARLRFRCIRHGDLKPEVILDNIPNSAHSAFAQPCILGACDAFISHSWHDDGPSKWKALQTWSIAFARQHNREPSFWLDKCCIDQRQIDMDLRCLPIFLKGCRKLVVLCGPTYLSRLWCILEIFVHIHMGGTVQQIELLQVLREGHETEDEQAIEAAFDTFDARHCQCFDSTDQQRMLSIIEVAFGSLDAFNSSVRSITRLVRSQLSSSRELTSVVVDPRSGKAPEDSV